MNGKRREVTEKMVSANQRNARKSTGPKTERGKRAVRSNRFVHGGYTSHSRELRQEMLAIGEDPDLVKRFERDLCRAWQPADEMQAMLISGMAQHFADKALMRKVWRKTRLGEQLDQQAALQRAELSVAHDDAIDEFALRRVGYRGMKPCQTALDESRRLLDELFLLNQMRMWQGDHSENSSCFSASGRTAWAG